MPIDENAHEALRRKHQVRPVTLEEQGSGIDRLPPGVYGFTYSPASENSPLFRDRRLKNYEMHKLPDGSRVLLGYVTPDAAAQLDSARDAVTVRVLAEPEGQAQKLVEIPIECILKHRELSQRESTGLELVVKPGLGEGG